MPRVLSSLWKGAQPSWTAGHRHRDQEGRRLALEERAQGEGHPAGREEGRHEEPKADVDGLNLVCWPRYVCPATYTPESHRASKTEAPRESVRHCLPFRPRRRRNVGAWTQPGLRPARPRPAGPGERCRSGIGSSPRRSSPRTEPGAPGPRYSARPGSLT